MGLFSTVFGGSKSKSSNQAYGQLSDALGGTVGSVGGVNDQLSQLLGGGFNEYLGNAGFSEAVGQGLDDIDAGAAGAGLLRSGSTAKAYGDYTTGLRKQFFQNYLDNLYKQAGVGLQAGNVLAGAGGVNKSKGSKGLGGFLGGGLAGIAGG